MTLDKIMQWKVGNQFSFQGKRAEVRWIEDLSFLIQKGEKGEPDRYWKSFSICFAVAGQSVTLTSSFPAPKLLELDEFQLTWDTQETWIGGEGGDV